MYTINPQAVILSDLATKEDVNLFLSKTEVGSVTSSVEVTNDELLYTKDKDASADTITLKAPIDEGAEIGTVSYKDADGNVIAQTKVYSSRAVEKANLFMRIIYGIKNAVVGFVSHISILKIVAVIVIIVVIIIIIIFFKNRNGGGYGGGYYSKPKYKYKRRGRF